MIFRPLWVQKIQDAWNKRPLVWLTGVRQVGKTTLTGMIPGAVHLNCDLPSVQRRLRDPETFYDELPKNTEKIRMWIRDISGKTVWEKSSPLRGGNSLRVTDWGDPGRVPAGVYVLNVQALNPNGRLLVTGARRVTLPGF